MDYSSYIFNTVYLSWLKLGQYSILKYFWRDGYADKAVEFSEFVASCNLNFSVLQNRKNDHNFYI